MQTGNSTSPLACFAAVNQDISTIGFYGTSTDSKVKKKGTASKKANEEERIEKKEKKREKKKKEKKRVRTWSMIANVAFSVEISLSMNKWVQVSSHVEST